MRGSDPHSRHSVHNTAGDTWPARANGLIATILGAAVYKTGDKSLRFSPIATNRGFWGLVGEKNMTPWATCRPLNDGTTRCFRRRHLH